MSSALKNILLVRTDRIGDVVLSLPCAALVKRALPGARVTFLAREYTAPLARMSPDVDAVLEDDPAVSARPLARMLMKHSFDAAVLLHPTARLAWALRQAGIPVRAGTAFRWYSFLLNRRVRQHRRYSLKHELEHNLELVAQGLKLDNSADSGQRSLNVPRIVVCDDIKGKALKAFQPSVSSNPESYIVIHPGSGGSAMDWPLERFAELIDRIQDAEHGILNARVVVTLGPGEESLKAKLNTYLKTGPVWAMGLSLPELAGMLSWAKLVIANSTGPLHIAAAVGARVIGLYCPVVPCHPRRWGPYGEGHAVIMPDDGKTCRECAGLECDQYDCMKTITVDRVLAKAREMTAKP